VVAADVPIGGCLPSVVAVDLRATVRGADPRSEIAGYLQILSSSLHGCLRGYPECRMPSNTAMQLICIRTA